MVGLSNENTLMFVTTWRHSEKQNISNWVDITKI